MGLLHLSVQNTRPDGAVDLLELGQGFFAALSLYVDHHIADIGGGLQLLTHDVDPFVGK